MKCFVSNMLFVGNYKVAKQKLEDLEMLSNLSASQTSDSGFNSKEYAQSDGKRKVIKNSKYKDYLGDSYLYWVLAKDSKTSKMYRCLCKKEHLQRDICW